jgi:hypothetical protein
VLVAPQVLSLIDADGDGEISEAEGQAYARAVLGDVRLGVDQHREPLILTTVELPPVLSLKSGLGTIRFEAAAESDGPPIQAGPGAHRCSSRMRTNP